MTSEMAQLWQDYESGKTFIINQAYKQSQKQCLPNGTFQARFNSEISGTCDKEMRKLRENKKYLCKSIKKMKDICSPSLTKLEGYTQYPRPKTKQISNTTLRKRNLTGGYSRVKSVKFFNKNAPSYLSTNYLVADFHKTGTASSKTRNNISKKYMTHNKSHRNLKCISSQQRVSSETKTPDVEEAKTLEYYQKLKRIASNQDKLLISPSTNLHKIIRTIRPTRIESVLDEQIEVKKPPKLSKGKKDAVVEDPQQEPSDRTIKVLEETSVSEINLSQKGDEDYLGEHLRKRTSCLMKKKLSQFEKAGNIIKEFEAPKSTKASKARMIFHKVPVKTSGQQWRDNHNFLKTINPNYFAQEKSQLNKDKMMLLKRRDGTIMKNFAMQLELEMANKKSDKKWRRTLY
ncbi:unnamed protein product [Moneuplotes crassus]|uniref:Uncharacterized protein n=1 Tax=Euplotes crassus TaxID=5936 RepID=A0AAD1ULH2_EUPCR|nr:unnamed protein product [Moneuplotes crassus]